MVELKNEILLTTMYNHNQTVRILAIAIGAKLLKTPLNRKLKHINPQPTLIPDHHLS